MVFKNIRLTALIYTENISQCERNLRGESSGMCPLYVLTIKGQLGRLERLGDKQQKAHTRVLRRQQRRGFKVRITEGTGTVHLLTEVY